MKLNTLPAVICGVILLLTQTITQADDRPHVLWIAGDVSHAIGEHEFTTSSKMLVEAINAADISFRATYSEGWPDQSLLEKADAVVIYSDGEDNHVALGQEADIRALMEAKKGIAVMHYALEPTAGSLSDLMLEAIGGRFKIDWSVNPMWTMDKSLLSNHIITSGVPEFSIRDEWFYHFEFLDEAEPYLQAHPPLSSLREDGPRSGNPTVRAALENNEPQTLGWTYEVDGRRAMGFTGAHFHANFFHHDFRRLLMNAVAWVAGAEIPEQGIEIVVDQYPRTMTIDEAIARNNIEDIDRHIALFPERLHQGANPRMTPLQQAVLRNRSEISAKLIDAGAEVDQIDRSERSLVHLAMLRKNPEILKLLLDNGASSNTRDKTGWTPLHHAAAENTLDLAKIIVSASQTKPMTLSKAGGTPLHEAAVKSDAEMIHFLLKSGIDPTVVSSTGVTALDLAKEYNNEAAIEILEGLQN